MGQKIDHVRDKWRASKKIAAEPAIMAALADGVISTKDVIRAKAGEELDELGSKAKEYAALPAADKKALVESKTKLANIPADPGAVQETAKTGQIPTKKAAPSTPDDQKSPIGQKKLLEGVLGNVVLALDKLDNDGDTANFWYATGVHEVLEWITNGKVGDPPSKLKRYMPKH
jgi:hypothetical protein